VGIATKIHVVVEVEIIVVTYQEPLHNQIIMGVGTFLVVEGIILMEEEITVAASIMVVGTFLVVEGTQDHLIFFQQQLLFLHPGLIVYFQHFLVSLQYSDASCQLVSVLEELVVDQILISSLHFPFLNFMHFSPITFWLFALQQLE